MGRHNIKISAADAFLVAFEKEQDLSVDVLLIVNYFQEKLKLAGYPLKEMWREKSITAAKEVTMSAEYSHIPVKVWLACIDWVFSSARKQDDFWRKVTVVHFGTVIKMYPTYLTHKQQEVNCSGLRKYGKAK